MKNLINDYNMVKKRVEKVSDFNYAVELKNRLSETTQEVRQNEKQIKELEQEQRKKDIEMNRLMKDPRTDAQKRVDYNHQKLTYM